MYVLVGGVGGTGQMHAVKAEAVGLRLKKVAGGHAERLGHTGLLFSV